MAPDTRELIRRFYEEVWNDGQLEALDALVAEDYLEHRPLPGQGRGRAGLAEVIASARTAFPDLKICADEALQDGDRVVVRWHSDGTQRGSFLGAPPSGRRFHITGIDYYRVENGRLCESWNEFDLLGMQRQLGLAPNTAVVAEKAMVGRALLDAYNAHDLQVWRERLAADFVAHYPGAPDLQRETALRYHEAILAAFPDIRFDLHRISVDSDTAIAHWRMQATHTGTLFLPGGVNLPPTERPVRFSGVFVTQTRGLRIVREDSYWDRVDFREQLAG